MQSRTFVFFTSYFILCSQGLFGAVIGQMTNAENNWAFEIKSPDTLTRMSTLTIEAKPTNQKTKKPEKITIEKDAFDACMPEHNHCMVVKSEVTPQGDNSWLVKGVKLHMKGSWEFHLSVKIDKKLEKLKLKVEI